MKKEALEPIYEPVFMPIFPSSLIVDGNAKAEIDADAEGGARWRE